MHHLRPDTGEITDVLQPYVDGDRTSPAGGCWVMANMVAGLDGTAAMGGNVSGLSSERDYELFLRMRGLADVVLVGAETVRRERYGPVRLSADLDERRQRLGMPPPRIAVVSRSLNLDLGLPLFTDADPAALPFVVTCASSDTSSLAGVPAEVITAGEDRVDLAAAIAELAARSVGIVLCEGGPMLLGQLIADGLLDEYCLTISPIVGGDPLPVVNTSMFSSTKRFRLAHVIQDDSTLFLRYTRDVDG